MLTAGTRQHCPGVESRYYRQTLSSLSLTTHIHISQEAAVTRERTAQALKDDIVPPDTLLSLSNYTYTHIHISQEAAVTREHCPGARAGGERGGCRGCGDGRGCGSGGGGGGEQCCRCA